MTDNEIVLNLLDFYKKKGIDLYKVLDDPTFKALSLDTKLKAIQMYAGKIMHGTPATFGKSDFKSVLSSVLLGIATGAAGGAFTAAGLSRAFVGGSIPAEAVATGAVIGGLSGAVTSGLGAASQLVDRSVMRRELVEANENPTPKNALNVLTANHIRTTRGEAFRNLITKTKTDLTKVYDDASKEQIKRYVEEANVGKQHI